MPSTQPPPAQRDADPPALASTSRFRRWRMPTFVAALALLLGAGAATVWGVRSLDRSRHWVEHTYQVIHALDAADAALYAAKAGARGYRLTGHRALQAEYLTAAPRAEAALSDLVRLTADNPQQQARAQGIRREALAQLAELQRLIDIQNERGRLAAQAETRVDGSVRRMQRQDALAAAMRGEELRLLDRRQAASERNVRLLQAFVLLAVTLSLVLLGVLLRNLALENRRSRRLERDAQDAMRRLRQSQALSERLSEQRQALSVYAGLLQSCHNLDEAMELTAGVLQRQLPHAGGRCYIGRPSRDFFETLAHFGSEAAASSDLLKPDECWGLRRGQPHRCGGGSGGMRCAHLDPGAALDEISTLCVPLVAHGDTLGLLHLGMVDAERGDDDEVMIAAIAEHLAMAMANLRLRETLRLQSLRDPLTGLFNRRYLEENLQRELHRCQRKGLPLSVLMLDVDHFKRFNDQHGHAAGDAVLAHVGRVLQSLTRNEDLACRYGGEEFTIVLPETEAATALARAEEIRRAISATTILHLRKTLGPVTISAGVATFPQDGSTPELLLELADASLYRAKAAGRDRVLHATALA